MFPALKSLCRIGRQKWQVRGQVQGVGFRPFVYRLAREQGLSGFVRNDGWGVTIEVQGRADQLGLFEQALQSQCPPLARIEQLTGQSIPTQDQPTEFYIDISAASGAGADVTVDTAVCEACLRELTSPADRRHGYGLINCTHCGPRYSIIQHIPYDRANTTMAPFNMCPTCAHEYNDPSDRRFHAQPTACHDCGPSLQLVDPQGQPLPGDPIIETAQLLAAGKVVAIKGLGGFHLAVRADHDAAVNRLRAMKHRDAKPFALMCRDIHTARTLVQISDAGIREMQSPACPIILAPRKPSADIAHAVAADQHRLGVMLPYTPIQHLLFNVTDPRLSVLVMTSANRTDEPLVIRNIEAVDRLSDMCDAILWHDRDIQRCVDDSVLIDAQGGLIPIRRSRGYVPMSVQVSHDAQSTDGLCLGGELKNTIAVVNTGRAILSQHLGELRHVPAYTYFKTAVADMLDLFSVKPQWIAHDLHPMYLSTAYARHLAAQCNVPLLGIQHHHAHAASLLAEHHRTDTVLAVVCDGVGYGTDNTMWGGELMLADLAGFKRLARLRLLNLPGGDAAARDTRRCALALLHQAMADDLLDSPAARTLIPDESERHMLCTMIRRNMRCVPSSAAGRVFDALASLIGICNRNQYEGQAGMMLEAAASQCPADITHEETDNLFTIREDEQVGSLREIDLSPLAMAVLNARLAGQSPSRLAALCHEAIAAAWEAAIMQAVYTTGIHTVALSGGVFCNERLVTALVKRLALRGIEILRHRLVPPGDGGLSLGQAAIAAAWSTGLRNNREHWETVNVVDPETVVDSNKGRCARCV